MIEHATPLYVVIVPSEDGPKVHRLSRSKLLEKLAENYWGDIDFSEPPDDEDPNYWRNRGLIIEGRIVHPSPKEVVTTWDI